MMYDEASDGGAYYECWDKNGLKISILSYSYLINTILIK